MGQTAGRKEESSEDCQGGYVRTGVGGQWRRYEGWPEWERLWKYPKG